MPAQSAQMNRKRAWTTRVAYKKTVLPLLVLILGATASLFLFIFTRDNIEKEAGLRFERQASDAQHAIEARFISYFNVLYGLAALFNRSGTLSHAEFHDYVQALDLAHHYPGIRNLNY